MKSKKTDQTILKDALSLFLITVVAGFILGFVYQITKEPIDVANDNAKQVAYQSVFTKADHFEEKESISNALKQADSFYSENNITGAEITEVLVAENSEGEMIGYVMSVTGTEGYGGAINMTLGIDVDGTITGLEILSMSETAGLGAKCKDDEFKGQYVGINTDEVRISKTGKQADNEIDAISGATITTSAVTKAVNAGIAFVKQTSDIAKN